MKLLATGLALVLLVVLAFPFAHDAYVRYTILQKLDPVLTQSDRNAFKTWNGDAISFVKSIYARCELQNGADAAPCKPYRLALE